VGLPNNINDSRVLCRSNLYKKNLINGLFEHCRVFQNGFAPYLLGDKGYP
jgi:hypothetical protein